jgi:glycosyltransferase involved in cell wall biosynthesis
MEKKIKILQIIPTLGLGGAEIIVEHLSLALIEQGFDVSVVSLYKEHSPITERLEAYGIPIFYLNKKKGLDLKIFFRLYKLFKKEKPDVVHTHLYSTTYATPVSIITGVPTRIHTIHSIAKKEVGWLKRKVNKFFYKFCSLIPVAISPAVQESVISEYGLLTKKIPLIYNGVDIKKCIPKKSYIGNKIQTIIHIGSFKEAKNHLGLLESFKIVHDHAPNTLLKLIGIGDLENSIEEKVKELDLEMDVEFLGLKSNVYPYLSESDIFVLPSIWEGMPISLIEAMATGLPIVATAVGGVPDMIENKVTGILVSTDNEQIARALLLLINDCNLREKLGIAARNVSKVFSSKEMASNYAKLYKKTT